MTHKCAKCGRDAPYFTEIFLPHSGKKTTIYLCKDHQMKAGLSFLKEVA